MFSHTIRPILGKNPDMAIALSTSSGSIRPPSPLTVRKPTPDRACGPRFDAADMTSLVGEHLLARMGLRHYGKLVPHRPGRHIDGGLHACHRRRLLFQLIDGGVVGVHVVAERG